MKENVVKLSAFLVCLRFLGGHLGSQMVDLGNEDTDWVGGNDRPFREKFTAKQPHTSHFEHG